MKMDHDGHVPASAGSNPKYMPTATILPGGPLPRTLPSSAATARSIRRFNRFYTKVIGILARGYLDTPYSLQEARVIYEVGAEPGCTAKDIRSRTGFDQGYLSRLISRLESQRILRRDVSKEDGRVQELRLTGNGKKAFDVLNRRADEQVARLVNHLSPSERGDLVGAVEKVHRLLEPDAEPAAVRLRQGRLGDLGYLFHRQVVSYHDEFGYTQTFETYFSKGLAPYLTGFDEERDRLWVAESAGRPVGWVAVHHVEDRPGWAKLRWFYVEPEARGSGLGWRLLRTAVDFSRSAGYGGVFLWTVSNLDAARRLYGRAGFTLAKEEPDCPWAEAAQEQMWELTFQTTRPTGKRRKTPTTEDQ